MKNQNTVLTESDTSTHKDVRYHFRYCTQCRTSAVGSRPPAYSRTLLLRTFPSSGRRILFAPATLHGAGSRPVKPLENVTFFLIVAPFEMLLALAVLQL